MLFTNMGNYQSCSGSNVRHLRTLILDDDLNQYADMRVDLLYKHRGIPVVSELVEWRLYVCRKGN